VPPARDGFAVALAIAILIAVALLAALLIDAATAELRLATAARAESRVAMAAESALADLLARRLDTAALSLPAGSVVISARTVAADTVEQHAQLLQPGVARLVIRVATHTGPVRVFAGRIALVAIRRDSLVAGELRFVPLATDWLVAVP
jgi:hypothetical protein